MNWLQDKKNLPIVIVGFVVIMGLVVYFAVLPQFANQGGGASTTQTATNLGGPTTGPMPDSRPVGSPGAPSASVAPSTPPAAPSAPGGGGLSGASSTPSPGLRRGRRGISAPSSAPAGAAPVVVASNPKEAWREDPFLPWDYQKQRARGPRIRKITIQPIDNTPLPSDPRVDLVAFSSVPYLWPEDVKKQAEIAKKKIIDRLLIQQPPRRVAGIIFSQRVSALIETPDGFETVRPGDKLRDGTTVERIERDRVVLRTTDATPRLITIKLAAATIQTGGGGATSTPGPSGGPSYPSGYAPPPQM